MGRIVAGLFAALLCAAPLVMAQRTVVADVPFPFTVLDMKCLAGQWVFTRAQASPDRVMTIRNSTTGESVVFLINLDYWDTGKAETKLVFYRYGDRHFLREIREGRSVAAYLMAGDEEKRLQVAGVKRGKTAVLARLR